jgi:hypothetical protein
VRCGVTAETNTRRAGIYTKEPTREGIVHTSEVHNADDIVRGWSGAEAGSGKRETSLWWLGVSTQCEDSECVV